MTGYEFHQLEPKDDAVGHDIWMQAFRWLADRKIRQWLVPMSLETFQKRTAAGNNYGLFSGNDMVAAVALTFRPDEYWTDIVGAAPNWWLESLAISSGAHGQSVGKLTIQKALVLLDHLNAREVYLDCVDIADSLPKYYELSGFQRLRSKEVTYPSGNTFPMVLLRVPLQNHIRDSNASFNLG